MAVKNVNMLLLDHASWQLARLTSKGIEVTPPAELRWTELEAASSDIGVVLDAWRVKRRQIVVGLQADLCVSVFFRLPSQRQSRQRQAMSYLLEPYLPWPAEEFVADYEINHTECFAVATSLEPISGLIRALDDRGISTESIAPIARLALQHEFKQLASAEKKFLVVWGDDRSIDVWLIDKKQPILWRNIDLEPTRIEQELRQISLEECRQLPLVAVGIEEAIFVRLSQMPDFTIRKMTSSSHPQKLKSALQTAGNILAGSENSSIELRRDTMSIRNPNRSIRFALCAVQLSVLCLLAAVTMMLFHLGEQLDQQRKIAGDKQVELYRKLFPDSPVPVGVRSRLEGEHAKLMGMRGEVVEMPDNPSAVVLIERLLSSLPPDMRFRILEVRVESGRLYLVGQVREHADADRIAEELRKLNLVVESPSTHRLPQKGVEFRISGHFPPPNGTSREVKS